MNRIANSGSSAAAEVSALSLGNQSRGPTRAVNTQLIDVVDFIFDRGFLEIEDLGSLIQLNRQWNTTLKKVDTVWEHCSQKDGIPFVKKDANSKASCGYEYCKVLYPITISKRFIREYLGEPIGEVPSITEEAFNNLNKADPFEGGSSMKEKYRFIAVFPKVKRVVNGSFPFSLTVDGVLKPLDAVKMLEFQEEEVIVPVGKNWKRLFGNLLKGTEEDVDFRRACSDFAHSDPNTLLGKCKFSEKVELYFVRNSTVANGDSPNDQESYVQEKGLNFVPFEALGLLYAYKKIKGEVDELSSAYGTYTSDRFLDEGRHSPVKLASFGPSPRSPIEISSSRYEDSPFPQNWDYGVAPGCLVESLSGLTLAEPEYGSSTPDLADEEQLECFSPPLMGINPNRYEDDSDSEI